MFHVTETYVFHPEIVKFLLDYYNAYTKNYIKEKNNVVAPITIIFPIACLVLSDDSIFINVTSYLSICYKVVYSPITIFMFSIRMSIHDQIIN